MTTQPSDWAVARAFRECLREAPHASVHTFIASVKLRARELDASRDAPRAAEVGATNSARISSEVVVGEAGDDGYYLASFKRSHDRGYVVWWMPNDSGYTTDLEQAGFYTEIKKGYHDSEYTVPVPVSFIRSLRVRRMVDVGDSLNRALWTADSLRAAMGSVGAGD